MGGLLCWGAAAPNPIAMPMCTFRLPNAAAPEPKANSERPLRQQCKSTSNQSSVASHTSFLLPILISPSPSSDPNLHLRNSPLLSILLTLTPITTNAPTVEAISTQKTRKLPSRPFQKPSSRMRASEAKRDSGRVRGPMSAGSGCGVWVWGL